MQLKVFAQRRRAVDEGIYISRSLNDWIKGDTLSAVSKSAVPAAMK
jgi:hypothetical protein